MDDDLPQRGFTQEQLVIYKLGQIESQLAALLVKLTDNTIQFNKDIADVKINSAANTTRIEKLENKTTTERAWLLGAGAAISAIFIFSKELIVSWLTSFIHH